MSLYIHSVCALPLPRLSYHSQDTHDHRITIFHYITIAIHDRHRIRFEMSHSFLGPSRPLRDDELIKWASDGFPSDKLWNAPIDTILDAASEFIVFRDLTLQRLKILSLTVKCLPGTSDEGLYAEAFPVSHTARLNLATLIMRFSVGVAILSRFHNQLTDCRRFPPT